MLEDWREFPGHRWPRREKPEHVVTDIGSLAHRAIMSIRRWLRALGPPIGFVHKVAPVSFLAAALVVIELAELVSRRH